MKKDENKVPFMEKIATFIVDKRKAFYLVFAVAVVFCVLSISKTNVITDLTAFLPEDTETRVGVDIMAEEFKAYGTAQVMISNITYDKAREFAGDIEKLEHVLMVTFDNTPSHYADSSALLMVSFRGENTDAGVVEDMGAIREMLSGFDVYYSTTVGQDWEAFLANEMIYILLAAALVIFAVLIFTSKSYLEIVVFLIVFVAAAALNIGTNFLLGGISFVTNSIAVILQLALAVDYSIILCHRFMEERAALPAREACIKALSKAIVEISSSSLTTIAGLVALCTMQFRLGFDMGIVLIKGIVFSMLTVFLLMPGLLILFSKGIDKTRHRSFVPNISVWGRFVLKARFVILPVFLLVFVASIFLSFKCDYVFTLDDVDTVNPSESRIAQDKIKQAFGSKSTFAVVVPCGDYDSEKAVIGQIGALPDVIDALGLAAIEVDDSHVLTDRYTPRQFAELANVDIELSRLLYRAYGLTHSEYGAVFQDSDGYGIPLVDIFNFLVEQTQSGVVTLTAEQQEKVDELNATLQDAFVQLEGENWSRMVFTADVPVEGEQARGLMDEMRAIASRYYGEDVILVGESTMAVDLSDSFAGDNVKISVLTALFVMIILLFTFKSVGIPLLLILTIQGSIFINFSYPFVSGTNLFFISYLIVSAIQMGATIDYAILLTNRYLTLKGTMDKRAAVVEALNQSFPTIITSGTILTAAGFLVGNMCTQEIISSIGISLGRGTLISVILVMTVLPLLLYLGDSLIERTALTLRIMPMLTRVQSDELKLDGKIRGSVSGYVDGEFKGVIRGSVNAALESKTPPEAEDGDEVYRGERDDYE